MDQPSPTPSPLSPPPPSLPPAPLQYAAPEKRAKPPMLAWWALVPVIAWIFVVCVYVFPTARRQSTSSVDSVSQIVGNVVGGLLISLLIGWIAYRSCRRSQVAASITFAAMLAICCLSVVRQSGLRVRPTPRASASPARPLRPRVVPEVGVSVIGPPGWLEGPSVRHGSIGTWYSVDPQTGAQQCLISVAWTPVDSDDIQVNAGALAKAWGGTAEAAPVTIDGEPAWRVVAKPSKAGLQPDEALLAMHGGHLFLIQGLAVSGSSSHQQVEFVAQNWKWTAVEPIVDRLGFQDSPSIEFNGRISMNFPSAMIRAQPSAPPNAIGLVLYDFRQRANALEAVVHVGTLKPDDTLEAAMARVAASIEQEFKLPDGFVWRAAAAGLPDRWITQPVLMPLEGTSQSTMWAMVGLGGQEYLMINYRIRSNDAADRQKLAAAAEQIVGTVTRLGDAATQPAIE